MKCELWLRMNNEIRRSCTSNCDGTGTYLISEI